MLIAVESFEQALEHAKAYAKVEADMILFIEASQSIEKIKKIVETHPIQIN
ncbi:hypothetical protein [Coxiella-like endosymbiont]|uniref:hypothetical protein n=1 Tax=Coxiella-like endosymbiont TaxID=1592897 RepID=UPI00272C6E48|nr:hypothetical protein [Coxiella-like endosymbiont]